MDLPSGDNCGSDTRTMAARSAASRRFGAASAAAYAAAAIPNKPIIHPQLPIVVRIDASLEHGLPWAHYTGSGRARRRRSRAAAALAAGAALGGIGQHERPAGDLGIELRPGVVPLQKIRLEEFRIPLRERRPPAVVATLA